MGVLAPWTKMVLGGLGHQTTKKVPKWGNNTGVVRRSILTVPVGRFGSSITLFLHSDSVALWSHS